MNHDIFSCWNPSNHFLPHESCSSWLSLLVDNYIPQVISRGHLWSSSTERYPMPCVGKLNTLNSRRRDTEGYMIQSIINSSSSIRSIRSYEYVPSNGLFFFSWPCTAVSQLSYSELVNYTCQWCVILKTALRLTVQADVSNNDSETSKNVADN